MILFVKSVDLFQVCFNLSYTSRLLNRGVMSKCHKRWFKKSRTFLGTAPHVTLSWLRRTVQCTLKL